MTDAIDSIQIKNVLTSILHQYPKSPALVKTETAVDLFVKSIEQLSGMDIPPERKKQIALRSMSVQWALKRVKDTMPENTFLLFYKHVIEGHSVKRLSEEFGVDVKTVRRAKDHAYKKLAIFLYPELVLGEIFTVGW